MHSSAYRGELPHHVRLQRLALTSIESRYPILLLPLLQNDCMASMIYMWILFKYISINSRHLDTIKFPHLCTRTDCLKFTVFNRFPVYFDKSPYPCMSRITCWSAFLLFYNVQNKIEHRTLAGMSSFSYLFCNLSVWCNL